MQPKKYEEFPLTAMGVLAPGSAHARPSARPPIDMSGNFPAGVPDSGLPKLLRWSHALRSEQYFSCIFAVLKSCVLSVFSRKV